MAEQMKAVVAHAPYDYRYESVDMPAVEPGDILLRMRACGVCAGDIKAYHGGIRIWGTTPENRYIEAPVIGGHEFIGEVVQVADDVTEYKIGDRVVAEQILPCEECDFCHSGQYWLCRRSAVYGFKQYAEGGFAEYIKLSAASLKHKVPGDFSDDQGLLIEPMACGMHTVEQANIQHSDVVVVAGLGAIGLSMVNMAQLCLPKLLIGIDAKSHRVSMAQSFGADIALDLTKTNVIEEIMRLTGGKGCDVYIEASGSPKSVTQGLECLTNRGRFVQMGVFAEEVKADWNIIGDGKELRIIGSHLSALTYPAVIKGIQSGLLKTEGLVSHHFPLADWQQAFEAAEKDPDAMKVALVP